MLDWGIVAFTVAMALWGFGQGLIVGLLTLFGFGAGALLGSRVAPLVLQQGSNSAYTPLFAALGALIAGAIVAISMESFAVDVRERVVRGRGMKVADGIGGAALIGAVALGLVWVFGAVALHAPGAVQLRHDVQRSAILRALNDFLPPSGPLINALNRVDPAPSFSGSPIPVAPPNAAAAKDPDVRRASRSVVRVLGTACGLGVQGSGWVVRPGLVVTNAHVVAGEDDTSVTTPDGASFDATPVYYDPRNDLALLRVDAPQAPLPLAPEPRRGSGGAVIGYPENGPLSASPARFGGSRPVISNDAYGNGPLRRIVSSLRGAVRSGDSGGPLVDSRGRVLTTVFAATTSGRPGGFGVPNQIVAAALDSVAGPVDTGPCTG